ncbi:beta-xylosidase family glycoside hydrolase [Arthrobacter sp. SA17]
MEPHLGAGWISVRRFPEAFASVTAHPGWLTLDSDGAGLDNLRPAFLGRRQRYQVETVSATVDPAPGASGGLAIRYDEAHHYSIESDGTTVTARARVSSIEQSWTHPVSGGELELRIATDQPDESDSLGRPSPDAIALQAVIDGSVVTLAELDGRYLSAETAASFTGRVAGVFASRGTVRFNSFLSSGHEPS